MRAPYKNGDYSASIAIAASTVKASPAMVTWALYPAPVGFAVWDNSDCEEVTVAFAGELELLGEAIVEVSFWTKI